MKIYDFTLCDNLYLIGDIHGDFEYLMNNIRQKIRMGSMKNTKPFGTKTMPLINLYLDGNGELVVNDAEEEKKELELQETEVAKEEEPKVENVFQNALYIVLGDVGFGFSKEIYYNNIFAKFNPFLAENNCHLVFMRGNHDDPSYFLEEKIQYSNIITIPDYSIIKLKEHNALCVGGGISIDRSWRLSREKTVNKFIEEEKDFKKLYWENESLTFNEDEMKQVLESGINIDMFFSHIPPIDNEELGNKALLESWIECDETLKEDLDKEKHQMNLLFSLLKKNYNLIFCAWAHMHNSNFWKENNVLFYQLTINEFVDVKKMLEQQFDEPQTELIYGKPKLRSISKKRRSNRNRNDIF